MPMVVPGGIRQELVLNEAIVRIRKARGLSAGAKHKALLMILLAKYPHVPSHSEPYVELTVFVELRRVSCKWAIQDLNL